MGEIPALDIVNLKYAACLRQVLQRFDCVWGGGGCRSFLLVTKASQQAKTCMKPASSLLFNGVMRTSVKAANHHGPPQLGSGPGSVRCSVRREFRIPPNVHP